MIETYTFTSKSAAGVDFTFSIKKTFLDKVPQPELLPIHDLIMKHRMSEFLHNETGPALVINSKEYHEEYWVNGKRMTKEEEDQFTAERRANDQN